MSMMMSVLEKACRACKLEHALPTLVTGEKSVALISFWALAAKASILCLDYYS